MGTVKIVQGLSLLALTAVLSLAALLGSSALHWAQNLPSLAPVEALQYTSNSTVFARDGTRIGTLVPAIGKSKEPINRVPVTLSQVSPAALEALVASEDDHFFREYGFSPSGITKAVYQELIGRSRRGGSTITTELVKNTVLRDIADERSLNRKVKEFLLAVELEQRLTKREILQRYVNVVFWGGNVYGIREASQAYFGLDPIQLNLAQGLYLAVLVPAPNAMHGDFTAARHGMRTVLDKMVRRGTISRATAQRAWDYKLEPRGWNVVYDDQGNVVTAKRTGSAVKVASSIDTGLSRGVMLAVRDWLVKRYGASVVFGSGGLSVYTTIDVQAQKAAMAASRETQIPGGAQMAIVGIDPKSGGVLAMVGQKLGTGRKLQDFNRAIQAYRQPGSSFKPIVYATGIQEGALNEASILVDDPTTFKVNGKPDYTPKEWDKSYEGYETARLALDRSRNIPAVKALQEATAQAVAAKATMLGYDVKPYLGMALGSFVVTPMQHAAAIAAFANGGVYTPPYFVSKVVDANGNVLYRAHPRRTRVWSPQTAYVVLDMMHGTVMDRKPYWALSWRASVPGRWIAGKTGTTDKERDIWFVGATPGMVATVWIGNDDDTPMPRHMKLADGTDQLVTSSQQPIYAFNRFVSGALRGHSTDPNGFPVPPGIVFHTINLKTGALDPTGTKAAFEAGSALTSGSLLGGGTLRIAVDEATGLRATAATPPDRIRVISVDPKNVGALFGTDGAAGPSASAGGASPGSSPSTSAGGSSGPGAPAR